MLNHLQPYNIYYNWQRMLQRLFICAVIISSFVSNSILANQISLDGNLKGVVANKIENSEISIVAPTNIFDTNECSIIVQDKHKSIITECGDNIDIKYFWLDIPITIQLMDARNSTDLHSIFGSNVGILNFGAYSELKKLLNVTTSKFSDRNSYEYRYLKFNDNSEESSREEKSDAEIYGYPEIYLESLGGNPIDEGLYRFFDAADPLILPGFKFLEGFDPLICLENTYDSSYLAAQNEDEQDKLIDELRKQQKVDRDQCRDIAIFEGYLKKEDFKNYWNFADKYLDDIRQHNVHIDGERFFDLEAFGLEESIDMLHYGKALELNKKTKLRDWKSAVGKNYKFLEYIYRKGEWPDKLFPIYTFLNEEWNHGIRFYYRRYAVMPRIRIVFAHIKPIHSSVRLSGISFEKSEINSLREFRGDEYSYEKGNLEISLPVLQPEDVYLIPLRIELQSVADESSTYLIGNDYKITDLSFISNNENNEILAVRKIPNTPIYTENGIDGGSCPFIQFVDEIGNRFEAGRILVGSLNPENPMTEEIEIMSNMTELIISEREPEVTFINEIYSLDSNGEKFIHVKNAILPPQSSLSVNVRGIAKLFIVGFYKPL